MKNTVSFNSNLSKFGIGLFETIKVKNCPIDLELHMDRLFNSIKLLNLPTNLEKSDLENKILEYIKNKKCYNKALKITVFDEGYNISTREIPYNSKKYIEGFKIDISPIRRGDSILYRHKTTNYFENIYTKNQANSNGFDDGLFLNTEGIILECSMSNIFFIKENIVFTPSSDLPILNGTKKKRIIEVCKELDIILREDKIHINEIDKFDFAFVSNSLMEVMKVVKIDKIDYDNKNKIFDKIVQALNK